MYSNEMNEIGLELKGRGADMFVLWTIGAMFCPYCASLTLTNIEYAVIYLVQCNAVIYSDEVANIIGPYPAYNASDTNPFGMNILIET